MLELSRFPMFSFDSIKFFLLATIAIFFVTFTACRTDKTPENVEVPPAHPQSNAPFSNREPDVFQAEIVVRSRDFEDVAFVARNGSRRRTEFGRGSKREIVLIESDRRVVLIPSRRIFTEQTISASGTADDFGDFLTTEWLSDARFATFERIGIENGLTKYKVAADGETDSESYVFVDESLGFPVRQEHYSAENGERKLFHSVELRGLRINADDALFEIPAGFARVTAEEFAQALRDLRIENE